MRNGKKISVLDAEIFFCEREVRNQDDHGTAFCSDFQEMLLKY